MSEYDLRIHEVEEPLVTLSDRDHTNQPEA